MKELRDLEEQYNVPLFLNLSCTIRDRSHLSSTMVSTPAEYLPVCLGELCRFEIFGIMIFQQLARWSRMYVCL